MSTFSMMLFEYVLNVLDDKSYSFHSVSYLDSFACNLLNPESERSRSFVLHLESPLKMKVSAVRLLPAIVADPRLVLSNENFRISQK